MLKTFSSYSDLDVNSIMNIYAGSVVPGDWRKEFVFTEDLRLFFQCKDAYLALWSCDGIPVSAVRIEPYSDGYLLSCLETAPQSRRKGFARSLLQAVMEYCPGTYYAHVDGRNKASMALHRSLGFQVFLDYAVHVDGSVYANSFTFKR
jgi:ribosomal protein S18 acetylase RimI-like enzyme